MYGLSGFLRRGTQGIQGSPFEEDRRILAFEGLPRKLFPSPKLAGHKIFMKITKRFKQKPMWSCLFPGNRDRERKPISEMSEVSGVQDMRFRA